ncbi:MAG TPA: ImmA/IrrE family metallo-endopeptidase [Kofleriaceae bacterium]|nr:ImmA/IrrE family metallo-endopeptidase [Kofleriaceae bacterium]
MRDLWIRRARQAARALSRRFGVTAPEHINIEVFAARLGATVTVGPLEGAIAQLVRVGSHVHIVVSERVTDDCAIRFSIAHELGHFVLGHPSRPPSELCGGVRPRAGASDARNYELEANAFAGELLMPSHLLQRWCEVSPVSMEIPRRIAREYNVSILASAIQFAELSSERCAAVFSARREVVWSASSATFEREIPRGRRIDPHSVAWDFYVRGELDDCAQPVPADAWLDTSIEVDIVEHSIASPQHGTVLSLLWIPERSASRLSTHF